MSLSIFFMESVAFSAGAGVPAVFRGSKERRKPTVKGGANIALWLEKCKSGHVTGIDYSEVSVDESKKRKQYCD